MNLKLTRKSASLYGVFGEISDESGKLLFVTLEHAFADGAAFIAKLAPGTYICKRGTHRLHNLNPFETFEISGVPDFHGAKVTGILFHVGNYNKDSEGCVLLGSDKGTGCILESRPAFQRFMELQDGVESFTLTVS